MLSPLKHKKLWFSMAYAMLILVGYFSLVPLSDMDMNVSDKTMHYIVYFGLCAGFMVLVQSRFVWVALGLILYGIALEFLQGLTGYRMMEVYDMLANSLGVLTGIIIRFTPAPSWFRQLEQRF